MVNTHKHKHNPKHKGVVGCISPWNFPIVLSFIDAIPALVAGCTVVIKPSEVVRFRVRVRGLGLGFGLGLEV